MVCRRFDELITVPRWGHASPDDDAPGDGESGCWSDRFTARWLRQRVCG